MLVYKMYIFDDRMGRSLYVYKIYIFGDRMERRSWRF